MRRYLHAIPYHQKFVACEAVTQFKAIYQEFHQIGIALH